ncbi:MAG: gamma-glutamylcyclotransferase family protein [Vicinamibacterales bacterium]
MTDKIFVYGTLMAGFDRRKRAGIDTRMRFLGRGWIAAALYDIGLFPAAVPAPDRRAAGELYDVVDDPSVLAKLDEIEGYRPDEPETSLYQRSLVTVTLENGAEETAWVYFYNAPLGQGQLIESGDYLTHLRIT